MWKLDYKESWVLKNWCFWNVVLEKTLESSVDSKAIQIVHPKGNHSWIFIGRTDVEAETPILWPPNVKNWLIWRNPDAGKEGGWEEKGTTEDEMAGWHHRLNGHEFEWTPGVRNGQGSWCAAVHGVVKSRTGLSYWTELNWRVKISEIHIIPEILFLKQNGLCCNILYFIKYIWIKISLQKILKQYSALFNLFGSTCGEVQNRNK